MLCVVLSKLISLIFGTAVKKRRRKGCELYKVDIFDIRTTIYGLLWLRLLWIAQKLISLIFGTTTKPKTCNPLSCELLSKVDIFDIQINKPFLLSYKSELWCSLSWYLWYSEQLDKAVNTGLLGCELLSKVDIFDIRNNFTQRVTRLMSVVNCSQKLISLIFGTTRRRMEIGIFSCELLSKVDIFDIRNNFETMSKFE